MVVVASYSSKLISSLTVRFTEPPVKSLKDLVESRKLLWTYLANSAMEEVFKVITVASGSSLHSTVIDFQCVYCFTFALNCGSFSRTPLSIWNVHICTSGNRLRGLKQKIKSSVMLVLTGTDNAL